MRIEYWKDGEGFHVAFIQPGSETSLIFLHNIHLWLARGIVMSNSDWIMLIAGKSTLLQSCQISTICGASTTWTKSGVSSKTGNKIGIIINLMQWYILCKIIKGGGGRWEKIKNVDVMKKNERGESRKRRKLHQKGGNGE